MEALLGVAFAAALFASVSRAAPPDPPSLTGTNPASPSASWQQFAFQPFVRGNVEGVVISRLGDRTASLGPVTMAVGPEAQVAIYDDRVACEAKEPEASIGEGPAAELQDPGIQIEAGIVAPDSQTTFYATVIESGELSKCSDGFVYRQVSSPPTAPVFTATVPASPANNNQPRLGGTVADPQATVSIYPNASCPGGGFPSGGPLATGSGAQFGGEGIQVSVPDNSTTTFSVVATLAGFSSACSSSTVTYVEETPAGPGDEGGGGGGGGSGGESGGGGGGSAPSDPPAPNPPGKPPTPKLRTMPEGIANDNMPSITGKASEAAKVLVFGSADCKGLVLTEGSPAQFSAGLPVQVADNTTSAFYGIAVDGGGDRSPCSSDPAIYVEDSTPPRTRITAGPGVKTQRRKVLFRFADVTEDLSAHFVCRLDRRRWGDCSSPLQLRHLGYRRHLLRVKAIDAAGNQEKTGTKRSFRVVGRR